MRRMRSVYAVPLGTSLDEVLLKSKRAIETSIGLRENPDREMYRELAADLAEELSAYRSFLASYVSP